MRKLFAACGLAAALGLPSAPAAAQAPRTEFDDVKLEVFADTHGVDPYPGELVLLRIRGTYRPKINLQKLIQPDLVNFGWNNLTRDRSWSTEFRNFPATGFERTMALFPEKTGPQEIGAFTHHLTVVDGDTNRILDVKSQPITLNVATWSGPGGPDDPNVWWLPSSDVRITDEWSVDPNRVPRGENVRRTVTIEADGVTAEHLPPPPVMRSPGVISFRGPNDRETRVTENGPVARAIYRWDMRPITAHPATMEAVTIPWFDTRTRTLREATIPAQRLAWAAGGGAEGEAVAPPPPAPRATVPQIVGAAAAGLAAGLALLLVGAKGGGDGPPRLPPREIWALRLAGLRRDPSALRAAVTALARREPDRARRWLAEHEVRAGLAELDRHLFYPGAAPPPDVRRLTRTVLAARRRTRPKLSGRSGLAPLDGPYRPG
jgi:hypothetical protein